MKHKVLIDKSQAYKIRKLAGSIKSKKVGGKRAIEKALTLEAKEVANEGKSRDT